MFFSLTCGPVSGGYEESITSLVNTTRNIVHERLKGDAWVTWAIAQRASLPMKIEACVESVLLFGSRYKIPDCFAV